MFKRLLLPAAAAALMTGPLWAMPALAPADPGNGHGPPSSHPNNTENPGSKHRSDKGTEHSGGSHKGSHKCTAHKVGYVVSGVLVSDKLEKNADGTYSGELTLEVKQANHHARKDLKEEKTRTYKEKELEKVHVTFGLADTNNDGSVGLDDVQKGDRVMVIGKITTLAKKCDQKEFKPAVTIRQVVFHAPTES
jgi:hypothetical protein